MQSKRRMEKQGMEKRPISTIRIITTIINIWYFNTFDIQRGKRRGAGQRALNRLPKTWKRQSKSQSSGEDNASGFINDRNYSYYYYEKKLKIKTEKHALISFARVFSYTPNSEVLEGPGPPLIPKKKHNVTPIQRAKRRPFVQTIEFCLGGAK